MKPLFVADPRMNGLESSYAQWLETLRMDERHPLQEWRFEPFRLTLAPKTYYRLDFLLVFLTHFEVHETKGHWEEDARVKFKVIANLLPWFRFVAVTRPRTKRERQRLGSWQFEVMPPHRETAMEV